MQNTDHLILHFFLCKVQTTQSNMFKYLKQKTIRMQMVSLITPNSWEQKRAPAECSIKYADESHLYFEGHINQFCFGTQENFWFVNCILVCICLKCFYWDSNCWEKFNLWCNINSLCLTHHWSWQQHLNITGMFLPLRCFLPLPLKKATFFLLISPPPTLSWAYYRSIIVEMWMCV